MTDFYPIKIPMAVKIGQLEAKVARLEAALSAAMRIIRRPDMLMLVDEGARPADGYWVRIEADWQFAGAELMDAITLLAGVEK